jgi:hypothetical protein
MTRVAREFENLLLAVRSAVSAHRPASCELLDSMTEKSKQCFAAQKQGQYWGLLGQVLIPTVFWGVGTGYMRAEPSTSLQWGSKAGDIFKAWLDAKGLDYQASQKQIDNTSAELAASNQGQATFLQGLETAMQRHQQILDNAKR